MPANSGLSIAKTTCAISGILPAIEFSTSAVTDNFRGPTRRLTDSFAACCRPPIPEIFTSTVERAWLNFDAASAVMKMFGTQSPARLETSMSFKLNQLCQPLLLTEALTDH